MNKIAPVALTGTLLLLAGCSLSSGGGTGGAVSPGSLADIGDLDGTTVTVSGKEFTEQQVLCEVTAQALESVNATVDRQCGISGSATVRSALESGEIDMYWEYTGTGWLIDLGKTDPITDPERLWKTLNEEDRKANGITWLQPTPANNTYAIAAASEVSEELGVHTISDYAQLAQDDPDKAGFCGAAEFFGRSDTWPGVQKTYGFELPKSNTAELGAGAVYNSIDKHDPCNFGEVFATDGRIKALDLTVLDDDKHFFTPYNPSLSIRSEIVEKNPAIADIFAPISAALTNETLQDLNAKVDVDGLAAPDVARTWLQDEGFIGE